MSTALSRMLNALNGYMNSYVKMNTHKMFISKCKKKAWADF